MTSKQLEKWIVKKYYGLKIIDTYGERSFFYNPENLLPKGIYFCTIKLNDGPNDKASNLNRGNIYRLSIGVGKKTYNELFGIVPKRPLKGKIVDLDIDFESLGVLMPHPIYSWISWVCILNPKTSNIKTIKYVLDISHNKVIESYKKKRELPTSANIK